MTPTGPVPREGHEPTRRTVSRVLIILTVIIGGLFVLALSVTVIVALSIGFAHGAHQIVKDIIQDTHCAITHGGGTGKHCRR